MVSLSQKNLMKLAEENKHKGNITEAIANLEEALRIGKNTEIVILLCDLYCENNQEDQAYALIKDEPDLFSDQQVYNKYLKILAKNHFLIEALEIENLTNKKISNLIEPVNLEKQKMIMNLFRNQKEITQFDYEQLLKLDLINFKSFAQSLLLDPSQNFAVRLSLCEDLIRLGIKDKIKIWVIGNEVEFIPADTELMEKDTIYREVIAGIGSRFRNNPSQLPIMLGETNLVLGTIFPKLSNYIDNPDSFVSDLISYLETGNGREHELLLKKIYANLPK